MSDGKLIFDTLINDTGFTTGLNTLNATGTKIFNGMKTAFFGLTAAFGAGAIAGVQYNAQIEQLQTSFEVMTGSAETAKQLIEDIEELGAKTPFEFTDLATSTQQLMAFGVAAEDTLPILSQLGDIAQGDAQKLETLTLSFGKMQSSQKVTLEYLNLMIKVLS